MSLFDVTPAGAFVNSIDAASKTRHHHLPSQPIEKPRKPIVRNFVMRLLAIFMV